MPPYLVGYSCRIKVSLSLQYGAKDGKLGDSVYKRLEAALIAFATVFALLQARNPILLIGQGFERKGAWGLR